MTQLTKLQQLKAQAEANVAVSSVDMSEVSKGGGARRLFPAGMAYARMIRYIEFGNHAREYQGVAKTPAPVVRIAFALWGDADPLNPGQEGNQYHHIHEGVVKPGVISSFDLVLGNNEKSKTKIAFDRMNYRGGSKNFAQFVGEAFLVPILVKKGAKADSKPYNEIDWKNILPPFDPMSRQPYAIPEAPDELYQLFLWDSPNKAAWDELFIDGKNDDGKSKNFLQAKCLEALNFRGSALEQLLGGALPDLSGGVEGETDPDEQAGAGEASAPVTAVPSVPGVPNASAVAGLPGVPTSLPDVPFDGGTPVAEAVATPVAVTTPVVTTAALPGMPGVPSLAGIPGLS